jgi:hypothetical protein
VFQILSASTDRPEHPNLEGAQAPFFVFLFCSKIF